MSVFFVYGDLQKVEFLHNKSKCADTKVVALEFAIIFLKRKLLEIGDSRFIFHFEVPFDTGSIQHSFRLLFC